MIHILAKVRLTAEQRAAQPEIGAAVGVVHEMSDAVVKVSWPQETSWVRREFVEIAG